MQRREQEVAAPIAREDPARPVPAVSGGSQPEDQDRRVRIAPARDRPAPVLLVGEARDLLPRDLLPPLDQPRAETADHDVVADPVEAVALAAHTATAFAATQSS